MSIDPFDPPDAACRHHPADMWFAEDGSGEAKEARRICRDECGAVFACLAYAISTNQRYGIWGGLSMSSQADAHARGRQRRYFRRWDS